MSTKTLMHCPSSHASFLSNVDGTHEPWVTEVRHLADSEREDEARSGHDGDCEQHQMGMLSEEAGVTGVGRQWQGSHDHQVLN